MGATSDSLLVKAISGGKAANVPCTSVPSRGRFEDTGDPRPIERSSRFDCDWDATEQAGSPSDKRCHNVATTGVDSGDLPEMGGHDRTAGT